MMFVCIDKILGACSFNELCPRECGSGVCPLDCFKGNWRCRSGGFRVSCDGVSPRLVYCKISLLFFVARISQILKMFSFKNFRYFLSRLFVKPLYLCCHSTGGGICPAPKGNVCCPIKNERGFCVFAMRVRGFKKLYFLLRYLRFA